MAAQKSPQAEQEVQESGGQESQVSSPTINVVGLAPAPPLAPSGSPLRPLGLRGGIAPRMFPYEVLRDRIRKAYLTFTDGQFNHPITLTDIRGLMKDVPRDQMDEALKRLHLEEGHKLSGLDNPRDRDAIVEQGALDAYGDRKYVLWITK